MGLKFSQLGTQQSITHVFSQYSPVAFSNLISNTVLFFLHNIKIINEIVTEREGPPLNSMTQREHLLHSVGYIPPIFTHIYSFS